MVGGVVLPWLMETLRPARGSEEGIMIDCGRFSLEILSSDSSFLITRPYQRQMFVKKKGK